MYKYLPFTFQLSTFNFHHSTIPTIKRLRRVTINQFIILSLSEPSA